jgi:hypothetical protein
MLGHSGTSDELLTAIEKFGYKTGQRKRLPDFVFFAAESIGADGKGEIMLSGCSSEFAVVLCYLSLARDEHRKIRPGAWSEAGPVAQEEVTRVPAFRAMRGAIAKANVPWWKL